MKTSLACLAGALSAALCFAASAAETGGAYPNRPIRFVVTYPPGGGTDFVARELGAELGKALGQPVIIDNRAGAGGTIGTDYVAKAAPDGYTLLFGTTAGMVINPLLKSKMPYDAIKDFEPVTLLATTPQILVVNASLPVSSLKEFIAYAKEHPRKLNYASVGIGAPNHVATEKLKHMSGIDLVHVPYKGAGPSITDLLGGQVQATFNPIPPLLPHINSGKLKALAVSSSTRSTAAPNVPTVAEAGVPGYEANFWYSVFVPARTPRPIIDQLNAALKKILLDPVVAKKLIEQGVEPQSTTPEELGAIMRRDTEQMADTIKKASITAD